MALVLGITGSWSTYMGYILGSCLIFIILGTIFLNRKKIPFGSKTFWWTTAVVLFVAGMVISAILEKEPEQIGSQSLTSPIEISIREWESWPDFMAPLGEFAYSEVPSGKRFDFEPQGEVLITIKGGNKAIKYTPGGPKPNLGMVFTKVGYMSLEPEPVKILRRVER